jgi:hypothetical protein
MQYVVVPLHIMTSSNTLLRNLMCKVRLFSRTYENILNRRLM